MSDAPMAGVKVPEPVAEKKPEDPASKPEVKATDAKPELKATDTKPDKPKRVTRNNVIFLLSVVGVIAGLIAAYIFGMARKAQPPVFTPVTDPFTSAIYANGIIESEQGSGENINVYPEVSGVVTEVLVKEGQPVAAGTPLLSLDDSVQRATTEQLRLQAEAPLAVLNELKAQPRKETLNVVQSQLVLAKTSLIVARDQYDKDKASYDADPKSISRDVLDTAKDTAVQAVAALDVARKQYDLVKAGAWSYDIDNQDKLYRSIQQSYEASKALLVKYVIAARVAGVVMAINATPGGYASPQGVFDTYTELQAPALVMGAAQEYLAVRCFVDEILVSRLPTPWHIKAQMSLRGSDVKIPLEFVRVQPYVSPKIELSNERQEQVDLRVLPVIFRFQKQDAPVYPGQLVDVFIGQK